MNTRISAVLAFLFGVASVISAAARSEQADVNPDFAYFYYGDTPAGWHWVLGDPGNWWTPLEGNAGVSEGGKLTMTASDSQKFPDAVKLVWNSAGEWDAGNAVITGRTVDLSAYEKTAQLVLALKLDERTSKPVHVKMGCGDECEAQVPIHHHLKKTSEGEWFALPIPLDCFAKQGADLKSVTSPFIITTTGEMVLHIAEISLGQMSKGDEGCIPDGETEEE